MGEQHFMTMYRILLCSLVLLLVEVARAQVSPFPDGPSVTPRPHGAVAGAPDSAAFAVFIAGIQAVDLGEPVEGPVSGYRLAWKVSEHGGVAVVTRGDDSSPTQRVRDAVQIGHEFVLPFRTAAGKRGLTVASDIPCGLICRTTWYYVEE